LITDTAYADWVSSIDLTKSRIVKFPSFIFLCGGPISKDPKIFLSCRDIFYAYIRKNNRAFCANIIRAEQVFTYFQHSDYHDLLNFEKDLAELSALTVLFSESPGSIAELGSFSVLKTIQDRLLVVMHQDDAYQESFIWRGPVLFLKDLAKTNGKPDPITIYNWRKKDGEKDHIDMEDFSDAEDLTEAIESIMNAKPKTVGFNKDQLGHIMLLMISILEIVQIATLEEIVSLLEAFGISHDTRTVKQHLSLLKSLGLIVLKPYRNYDFYLAFPHIGWISWAYTKTANIRDADRWKNNFIEYYDRSQGEKHRALRSYLRSTGKIGD
jgi:hypothetical protein